MRNNRSLLRSQEVQKRDRDLLEQLPLHGFSLSSSVFKKHVTGLQQLKFIVN
jgi:hypothetical protein